MNLDQLKQEEEKSGLYDETLEESETKCYCGHTTYCDCGVDVDFEIKQETLEEAAQEYSKYLDDFSYQDFEAGALWQQKQMYSEEDARKIWHAGQEYWKTSGESITFEELIEQFKKNKKI